LTPSIAGLAGRSAGPVTVSAGGSTASFWLTYESFQRSQETPGRVIRCDRPAVTHANDNSANHPQPRQTAPPQAAPGNIRLTTLAVLINGDAMRRRALRHAMLHAEWRCDGVTV
jgi:hypothetical protein